MQSLTFAAMSSLINNQEKIWSKLGIKKLNDMQLDAYEAIENNNNVIILSPTGTGKTLAFLLPILQHLDTTKMGVQAVIVVPTRELAIQIEQVIRDMGTGFKVNAVYGGRAFSKDKIELSHPPTILVGTPGRVADHLRRDTFEVNAIKTLVLDEFDKSLEIGFDDEMMDITKQLNKVKKRILTSATQAVDIPNFVGLDKPIVLNYLDQKIEKLRIERIVTPDKDKLDGLVKLLGNLGNVPGIIFCNFKDTIQKISDALTKAKVNHGCFYGGMEQKDRERALIQFRNKTHQIIVATDLAARGLDIPELGFIIHFQLPHHQEEFVHRNGRTARMQAAGTAYVLQWEKEKSPSYLQQINTITTPIAEQSSKKETNKTQWKTLFISGGRKDKISKGDIAGLFIKEGGLTPEQIGVIELKTDCSFVAVQESEAQKIIAKLNNTKLKKKKVRIYAVV